MEVRGVQKLKGDSGLTIRYGGVDVLHSLKF